MDRQWISKRALLLAAAGCAAALLVAACGDDTTATPSNTATAPVSSSTGVATASPSATAPSTGTSSASTTPANDSTPAANPKPPAYDDSTDPLRMLTSYVNAINRQDYKRAYGYWHNPSTSFADFEKGYDTTANVTATFAVASGIDAGAGQRRMLVSTVLDATHTDGSHELFSGCYVTWHVASGISQDPADNLWHIDAATVNAASKDSTLADLLASGCESYKDRVSNYGAAYDNQSGPLNVVVSLYDALNRKDYKRAYAYWEQAPESYDQFVAGYANTASTVVTTGTPVGKGAAAGSVYESVPVIVTGITTDGATQRFSGCYVARRSNLPQGNSTDPSTNPWAIYTGTLHQADASTPASSLLAAACPDAP